MINDDEREGRLRWFRELEERDLVVRRELPDGSAEPYFPQPNHPTCWRFARRRLCIDATAVATGSGNFMGRLRWPLTGPYVAKTRRT